MDDHIFNKVWDYAMLDLIPCFKDEFNKCGKMTECASYEEMQDLCKVLNIMAKYAGIDKHYTPAFFLND